MNIARVVCIVLYCIAFTLFSFYYYGILQFVTYITYTLHKFLVRIMYHHHSYVCLYTLQVFDNM